MSTFHHRAREMGIRPVVLSISADVANYDLFTAAGSPGTAVDVVLTINSGATVYSASPASPALNVGTFPAGSKVTIVVAGYIMGASGGGGTGAATVGVGAAGAAGGDAIATGTDLFVDNSLGYILGGGGGGGGGCGAGSSGIGAASGGGGGGGQGRTGGGGGAGGTAGGADGSAGAAGSQSAPGDGGAGGSNPFYGNFGSQGGRGGYWGADGDGGAYMPGIGESAGGAAGRAVRLNGKAITWVAGNNPTQVRGAVA